MGKAVRRAGIVVIPRTLWAPGFPDVVVHTTVARRDAHPSFVAGKAGQRSAATKLAGDLLSTAAVATIHEALGALRPVVVPIRAVETLGINLIPDAMARELGQRLGLSITTDMVQTNTVGHTRANGFHRLLFQPTFAGDVVPGSSYLLVDDHVGLGGTLANLRGHIESEGGRVVLTTTLSASRRSEVLALRAETLQALREKHGDPLERYWQESFGFGLDALTEAEAGYLLRTPSVDAVQIEWLRQEGREFQEQYEEIKAAVLEGWALDAPSEQRREWVTVDHFKPKSLLPQPYEWTNYLLSCERCNTAKSAKSKMWLDDGDSEPDAILRTPPALRSSPPPSPTTGRPASGDSLPRRTQPPRRCG